MRCEHLIVKEKDYRSTIRPPSKPLGLCVHHDLMRSKTQSHFRQISVQNLALHHRIVDISELREVRFELLQVARGRQSSLGKATSGSALPINSRIVTQNLRRSKARRKSSQRCTCLQNRHFPAVEKIGADMPIKHLDVEAGFGSWPDVKLLC